MLNYSMPVQREGGITLSLITNAGEVPWIAQDLLQVGTVEGLKFLNDEYRLRFRRSDLSLGLQGHKAAGHENQEWVDVICSRWRPTGPALWRNLYKLGRPRVLEKATGVRTEETPDNQHEEKAVNRELAQFAEAYDDVKGHPCTSKPASPIVRTQQKNTANDCEKLSGLDPDPIRRVTVTEVSNKTADTHGQIKAGDQDYRERNPLTAHSLAHSLGSVLVHRNLTVSEMFKNGMRPVHPGEVLLEDFLKPRGMSANALAKALCVPAPRINDVVRGRRGVSADTAMRLARYFGGDARSWLNLQLAYDLRVAEMGHAKRVAREVSPATS
jgi:antitoxin HigA-1